jgi:hypothetical protein
MATHQSKGLAVAAAVAAIVVVAAAAAAAAVVASAARVCVPPGCHTSAMRR